MARRTRTPTPSPDALEQTQRQRAQLEREADALVDEVTTQARRALAASLDQILSSEMDRFQKNLVTSLADLGIEAIAPELAGLAVEAFGGSVLGDAFAGSVGAALPGILSTGTVSPRQLGKAAVGAAKRGNLSRAQTTSATLRNLGNTTRS